MSHRFLPDKQPQVQFSFRIKKDQADEVERFRLWAQKEFGMDLNTPEVLSYIVNTHISDNKKFQREKASIKIEPEEQSDQPSPTNDGGHNGQSGQPFQSL